MAGDNIKQPMPFVESGQRYAAASLAWEVQNLQRTHDNTLRGVRGPAPLIPDYGSGYPWPGRVYGVFHALLDGGMRDVTLVRSGTKLMEQTGWTRGTRDLATGLSADPNARHPDCFVEVAGKVVWCNGVDQPRIYDGYRLLNLGYDARPGAPSATGPRDTGHPVFRNQGGYSHPGRVGSVGNFFNAQAGGALLKTDYHYHVLWEDHFGNRSALSNPGGPVTLHQEYTKDLYWKDYENYSADSNTTDNALGITLYPGTSLGLLSVTLDDLTRQILVTNIPVGPEGTRARVLYRSSSEDPEPRQVAYIEDNATTVFPDNTPDSSLGAAAKDYIPVPTFGIAWEHEGCLYIADGRNIRASEPGFPGSFERTAAVPLPSDPTGGFSFAGQCYATTETGIYRIERAGAALTAQRLPTSVGLMAARSGSVTALGVYVGLGPDGFWAMDAQENVTPISDEIRTLFRRLVRPALCRAAAVWDPEKQQYLCAVPEAGGTGNNLVLAWDGSGWRRFRYGMSFACMAVTKDWRRYVLVGSRNYVEDNVLVLDREVSSYTPPTRSYVYRSAWLRMDAVGRDRFNVDAIYVGIVETHKGASAQIAAKVWQNGSRDAVVGPSSGHTFEMVSPGTEDVLGALVLGTGRTRIPRLVWKRFDVRVKSVEQFAFDLTSNLPFQIAAFSFDAYVVDATGARVSRQ